MQVKPTGRVTEEHVRLFLKDRKERAVEKLFLGESELDFYDCNVGGYAEYALPKLFTSGILRVDLFDGSCMNVCIKTEYTINTNNMHREVHSTITNVEECRYLLQRSLNALSTYIKINYGKYFIKLVKDEWTAVKNIAEVDGLTGFAGYGFQVYPSSISTMGIETFSDLLKMEVADLNSEQKIAITDIMLKLLNDSLFVKNGIKFSYVREGAFGGRIQLNWSGEKNRVKAYDKRRMLAEMYNVMDHEMIEESIENRA